MRSSALRVLVFVVVSALPLLGATLASARAIMDDTTECLSQFQGVPVGDENGGTYTCTDCDPSCDTDGVATPNKKCTFRLQVCLNHARGTCTAANLKKVKAKGMGCKVTGLRPTPAGMSSLCGAFTGITVKTKKKGKKPGKCTISVMASSSDKPKKVDKDKLVLTCNPQPGSCPTPTTTTISTASTTTTTTLPGSCDCCSNTMLRFTTGAPSIGSGHTCPDATSDGTVTGTVQDASGATMCNLRSGGLYFGGAGVGNPLPSVVPDMGTSLTAVTACDTSTGSLTLGPTSPNGSTITNRTCTSASAADPEYPACVGGTRDGAACLSDSDCGTGTCTGTLMGCLFGPPLPIPNPNSIGTSTCVVNRVTADASGTGSCVDGSTTLLDIPLGSDIYLTGDIATDVPGIQPCPVCLSNVCHGGPKDGMACTPGSSALGAAYPTSHDCPPPADSLHFVGTLPIPFKLTTGASTKVSQDTPTVAVDRTFCGFCRTSFGQTFQGPPAVPCMTNADCTPSFPSCAQRDSGAFGQGDARTITETGSAAGACIADGTEHASTLVSVFCIPPSYNATVDSVGDLPSPGAVALPGKAQVLP